jgi:5-methyltetrahydrofolate--homocysteine methyltransferase
MATSPRDGARGLRHSAADRRRHHQPRPHRGQDRSELPRGRWCMSTTPAARSASRVAAVAGDAREAYASRSARRIRARSRAHFRGEADKKRLPLAKARANALKIDWAPIARRSPTSSAHAFDELRSRRTRALHRLDAVLPDLGAQGPLSRHPRRRRQANGGARLFDDAQAMLKRSSTRNGSRRKRCVGFWPAAH